MPGLDEAWAKLRRHQAAVAANPSSAADWTAIATLMTGPPLMISGGGRLTGAIGGPVARDAAERALAVDPESAEPHRVLGWISHFLDWDVDRAELSLRRAIELAAEGLTANRARAQLALLLTQLGRDDEAEPVLSAIDDPRLAGVATGQVRYLQRRFAEAAEHASPSAFWRGLALCAAGRAEEAVPLLEQGAEGDDRNPGYVALMAYAAVLAGDLAAADLLEAELRERGRTERLVDYQLATVAVARGELDGALSLLDAAMQRPSNWPLWLPRDVRFDPLRDDARFDDLLGRLPAAVVRREK